MASVKEWRGSAEIPSFGSSQGRSQGRPPRGSGSELTFQYHQVRRQEMRSSGVGGIKGIHSNKRPLSPRVTRSPLHPSAPSPTLEDAIREGLESTRPLRNNSSNNNHSWNESQSTRRGSTVFKVAESGGGHHQPKHPEGRKWDSDYVNAFMKKHGDTGGSGFTQVRWMHEQASSPGRASSAPKFRSSPLSPHSNGSGEPSIQALLSAIAGAKHLHQNVEPRNDGWEQSRLIKTPSRVRIKELDSEGGAATVLWPSRSPRSGPEPAGQSAPSPDETPPTLTPPTERQQGEEPQQPTEVREGGAEAAATTPPPSEEDPNSGSSALLPSEDNVTAEDRSDLSEVASNLGAVGGGESASSSTEEEMTSARPEAEAEVEAIPPPPFEEEEEKDVVFHSGEMGTPARFCWEIQSTGGASPATTLAHSRSVSSASAGVLHSRNSSLASSTAALHAKSASWGGRVVDEGQEGESAETGSPREDETGAVVKEGTAGKAEEPETGEGPSKVAQDFASARRHKRQGSTDKIHVPSFEDVLRDMHVHPVKRASDGDKAGEPYSQVAVQTNRLYGNVSFTSRSDDSSNASSSPRAGKSPAVMFDVQPSTSGPLSSSAVLGKEDRSFSGAREAIPWSSPPHATASWLGPDEKVQKRRKWYHMFLCGAPSAA